jgi:hypothetical protein
MKTEQLFYESVNDAVRVVVAALGGPKKVGPMLWPALGRSAQRLTDCLNDSRDEKLSPEELIKLARWGRDIGCHALASYFNAEAGYGPPIPISPDDEKAELQREFVEAAKYIRHLGARLELIDDKQR